MSVEKPAGPPGDDDFTLALAAMQRAAEVARQRARLRDGGLVVWQDGRIIELPAERNTREAPSA